MGEKNERLVWIDLEMTGLDIEKESIIEIATVITDGELNILATGPNLAVTVSEELLAGMDEWNTTHHTASGLVERVRHESVSCQEAEAQTLAFLQKWVPKAQHLSVETVFGTIRNSWKKRCLFWSNIFIIG